MPPICSFAQPAVLRCASSRVVANLWPAPITPDSIDALVSSTICSAQIPVFTRTSKQRAAHKASLQIPTRTHGSQSYKWMLMIIDTWLPAKNRHATKAADTINALFEVYAS